MGGGGEGVGVLPITKKNTRKAVRNSRRNQTDAYGMRCGYIGSVSHS